LEEFWEKDPKGVRGDGHAQNRDYMTFVGDWFDLLAG